MAYKDLLDSTRLKPAASDTPRIGGREAPLDSTESEKYPHVNAATTNSGSSSQESVNEKKDTIVVDVGSAQDMQRHLKPRHVQMLVIGGVIGTGLFLGTANNLKSGGPAGLLISYCIMATLLYSVMVALGEMVAAFPIPGGQFALAGRFGSPELGFAVGWLYWYTYIVLLPAEMSAAAVLISYWTPSGKGDATCTSGVCNNAMWVGLMLIVVIFINFLGTRAFGEVEFWAASIKVITILGLIIVSIIITAGGGPNKEPIGFRYWNETGGFVQYDGIEGKWGRFLGFFAVLISAAFAFIGTEIAAIAAAETANPGKTVPRAIKTVWVRLALFYITSAFLIGLLVSPSNPSLNLASTAAKSPFVIAIKDAGIHALPSIINAALLTSAWSACSAHMYVSSRTLYGLHLRGATPRFAGFLGKTRKSDGLPWVCVSISALLSMLSFLASTSDKSAGTVFGYFANMTAVCGMIAWSVILYTAIRFNHGLRAQGIDRATLPYRAPWQPFLSYYGFVITIVVIIFSGFTAFMHTFDASAFVTTYFGIPFFFVLLVGYKVIHKSKVVKCAEMDFVTGHSRDIAEEPPREPGVWGWVKANI